MRDLSSFTPSMDKCSHCAFCQATCPVFRADLLETHTPRARMELIRAVLVDKSLPETARARDIVSRCLLCSNCSQTCPAAVPVADIVALARSDLKMGREGGFFERAFLSSFMRNRGATLPWNLALHSAKLVGLAPKELSLSREAPFSRRFSGVFNPSGRTRERAAYFVGCATNSTGQHTAEAVCHVLGKNNIAVLLPEKTVCCGMPALARGDLETAKKMLAQNLKILAGLEAEAIVTDCTSCGLMLKEKSLLLFADDPEMSRAAEKVSGKIFEVTDYLNRTGLSETPSRLDATVTYHVPCHRGWSKTLKDAPRELLSQVPGLCIREMEDPEACCGAGGAFFAGHPALADNIRKQKHADILATGAKTLITQCPACRAYLGRQNDYGVAHPIELLARAFGKK